MNFLELLSPLAPYAEYLGLIFFVAFFSITGVAYYLSEYALIRKSYIAYFFCCLLAINIIGIAVSPMVHWHKFGGVAPEEQRVYEIRMADASGNEIAYDPRAAEPYTAAKMYQLAEEVATECDAAKQRAIAERLFTEAQEYRAYIESDPVVHEDIYKFPRHNLGDRWTFQDLESVGPFESVRVYKVDRTIAKNADAIETHSETIAYAWEATEQQSDAPDFDDQRVVTC